MMASMPVRPRSVCTTVGCAARTTGGKCAGCRQRYEQQRGSAAARGYDQEWQQLSAAHLKAHPWCACGCGKRATDVDHIVPVRLAPHRRLDPTNLRSFAHGCHSRKTNREDGGFGNRRALAQNVATPGGAVKSR